MECNSFFRSFRTEAAEEVEKGIRITSLSLGAHRMRRMVFEPKSLIPSHRHPEDVVTLILEGTMEMTVGGETRMIGSGDVFLVPAETDHHGCILNEEVVAVSFSRE